MAGSDDRLIVHACWKQLARLGVDRFAKTLPGHIAAQADAPVRPSDRGPEIGLHGRGHFHLVTHLCDAAQPRPAGAGRGANLALDVLAIGFGRGLAGNDGDLAVHLDARPGRAEAGKRAFRLCIEFAFDEADAAPLRLSAFVEGREVGDHEQSRDTAEPNPPCHERSMAKATLRRASPSLCISIIARPAREPYEAWHAKALKAEADRALRLRLTPIEAPCRLAYCQILNQFESSRRRHPRLGAARRVNAYPSHRRSPLGKASDERPL